MEPDVKAILAEKGISLVVEKTDIAVESFNKFLKAGKRVAGAFHLTC